MTKHTFLLNELVLKVFPFDPVYFSARAYESELLTKIRTLNATTNDINNICKRLKSYKTSEYEEGVPSHHFTIGVLKYRSQSKGPVF